MKRRPGLISLIVLGSVASVALGPLARVAPALANTPAAPFAGTWLGALEYRDFGNGQRVSLPTLLVVGRSNGGSSSATPSMTATARSCATASR
jgi:GTP-binding protein EngB required for normal cell division